MLAGQRQKLIVEELRRRGAVRVSELTEQLGVSDMTIRRDIETLAAAGWLVKVHGGAIARGGPASTDEPGFEAKSDRQLAEKEAIARAARSLVERGQALGLTAGTTTWRLAHLLIDVPDLTVVTNSIEVAKALHREPRPDLTVVLTGGVRTPSDALVGPVAVNTVRSLHIDILFMGVHGITEDAGFTTPNLLEAETNRAFIESAEQLFVLADHTKWGVRGLSRIAQLDEADALITDQGLPADAQVVLGEHVGRLVVATGRSGQRRNSASSGGR